MVDYIILKWDGCFIAIARSERYTLSSVQCLTPQLALAHLSTLVRTKWGQTLRKTRVETLAQKRLNSDIPLRGPITASIRRSGAIVGFIAGEHDGKGDGPHRDNLIKFVRPVVWPQLVR